MIETGSSVFGTTVVKTEEYVMLAKVIVDNGSSTEEAVKDIEMIDELLSLQRISSIIRSQRFTAKGNIRKDASLQDMISKRIDQRREGL